jgi:hypothetical protein
MYIIVIRILYDPEGFQPPAPAKVLLTCVLSVVIKLPMIIAASVSVKLCEALRYGRRRPSTPQ